MQPPPVAVLSDIHGNLTAFQAVLADIARQGISQVVNLGDIAGKGPRGSACVALSSERCTAIVQGNWEAMLAQPEREGDDEGLRWWRRELGPENLGWLGALPPVHHLRLGDVPVRFVHASAQSVFTRVFPDHSEEDFAGMFASTPLTGSGETPQVVCYGDIHFAYTRRVDARLLVNVGSVGNALDEPDACYAILTTSVRPASIDVEFVRVPYDVEAEIAVAESLGMPQVEPYAEELRTARYRRG